MMFDEKLDGFLASADRKIDANFYTQYGYKTFGPFLYGFCQWLVAQLTEKKMTKVYFLARDGALMKAAFDLLPQTAVIESHYLYSSRRSWIFPVASYAEKIEDVVPSVFEKRETLEALLRKLGLTDTELTEFSSDELQTRYFETSDLWKNAVISEKLKHFFPIIRERATKELQLLKAYLQQEGLTSADRIALVDIGWYGRTQLALEKIVTEENWQVDISGFYLGVLPFSPLTNASGFLFDRTHDASRYSQGYRSCLKALEAFFMGFEGSTRGFVEKYDGKIIADKEDFSAADAAIFSKNKQIQEGALQFIRDFLADSLSNDYKEKNAAFWQRGIEKSLIKSTPLAVANNIGDVYFDHGARDIRKLAEPQKLRHYLRQPRAFFVDLSAVVWLSGWLTRLFHLRAPYYLLLRFLR